MADDFEQVSQDEIEKLLKAAQGQPPTASTSAQSPPAAESGGTLGQGDIESLLRSAQGAAASTAKSSAARPTPGAAQASAKQAHDDIELLLSQAEQALASVHQPVTPSELPQFAPFQLADFSGKPASAEVATIELIRDVELDVKIELGRTLMYLEDVLRLKRGSVVPLDKLAGDPVDIYVNGRIIARGEVLVLNDNFCVRIAELVAGEKAVA
jgi:flagellar motor switch protein FliN/FliY